MKKLILVLALLLGYAAAAEAVQATATWSDDGSAQTRVERRDGVDANPFVQQGPLLAAGVQTFNQAGLVLGERYCYRVVKINDFGDSAPLGPACGTPDAPLPASGLSVIFAP